MFARKIKRSSKALLGIEVDINAKTVTATVYKELNERQVGVTFINFVSEMKPKYVGYTLFFNAPLSDGKTAHLFAKPRMEGALAI